MKLSLRFTILAGTLGALAFAAQAQSPVAKANVPFDFAAGGAMMPAGDYTVGMGDFSGVILLHGSSGKSIALLSTFSDASPSATAARLVFEKRDGMPYLSAVEWPGETAQVMSVFKHLTKGAVAVALH